MIAKWLWLTSIQLIKLSVKLKKPSLWVCYGLFQVQDVVIKDEVTAFSFNEI